MANTKAEIIAAITKHIKDRGGELKDWYVGITEDAEERLFKGHNVDKENDKWIYRTAKNSKEARELEKYFIDSLRTDGGPGGGDDDADKIYAYKKSSNTNP